MPAATLSLRRRAAESALALIFPPGFVWAASRPMPLPATFETFAATLRDLVARFSAGAAGFLSRDYPEAAVRQDFLDPFFKALGWDLQNERQLILNRREVEIESRTMIDGRKKRADYLFRTDGTDRFVCEAKKPAEDLNAGHAFQARRYARNKVLALALLTDFEGLRLYVVACKPRRGDPIDAGLWKHWHYTEYPAHAREIWDLLSRDAVAGGALDRELAKLPKSPVGKGRARQRWLIRPDRTRALDAEFLAFLDEARRTLGSDLLRHNPGAGLRDDLPRLNEAVQRILDRLLFLRICEDRDIDTGLVLNRAVENYFHATDDPRAHRSAQTELPGVVAEPPSGRPNLSTHQLWPALVSHFKRLNDQSDGIVPYFNGHLFKPHFTEELLVGDAWLADFLDDLGGDESEYLFSIIPVEILGTIYERFLGKLIRPQGLGVTIEEKPEVRKAGGVYYTPRYIVDYIVEQTVGKLLEAQPPEQTLALRFLDPSCGSGSFLIRVFERVCEHWQAWLTAHPKARKKSLCWLDAATGDVHLTAALKRRILTANIHGVDLDPGAVEVTQLALYLKMLEGENRNTLARERELFPAEDEPALLPPLADNIKCGNSLLAADFSPDPAELIRVRAFDWDAQFTAIMRAGGFDAVVGNPPYILLQAALRDDTQLDYFRAAYEGASFKIDTYHLFIERGIKLCRAGGLVSFITPSNFLTNNHLTGLRRVILLRTQPEQIVVVQGGVFAGVSVDNAVFVFRAGPAAAASFPLTSAAATADGVAPTGQGRIDPQRVLAEPRLLFTSGMVNPGGALWDRIAAGCVTLGDLADVNFGKQLRDRAVFQQDVIKVDGRRSVPRTHVACVTGKDIAPYQLEWSGLACLDNPVARSGGCWDEAKHRAKGKLLTRQIGRFPAFALDDVGYHCLNTIFMVTIRETVRLKATFFLGVLNSGLVRFLWTGRYYDQRRTFPKIKGTYLKALPIPRLDLAKPADRARHDRLVALVDKMLALTPQRRAATAEQERATLQNAVTATDRAIDRLVYDLYGLTPEETALVEGSGNSAVPTPTD